MNKLIFTAIVIICTSRFTTAQTTPIDVNKAVTAENDFNKLIERKGMKDAFLAVADAEGIVFKPQAVKINDFYGTIDKQPGKLTRVTKLARISANGDLAFAAGPYVYQNGKTDDDKVFGDYVSIWRADSQNKLKLLIDLGIQHPESEETVADNFKEPDLSKQKTISKDPFGPKLLITNTDKVFNHSLSLSALAAYKEFLSPEGFYYFPGFEPIAGSDKILKFLDNEAIVISAETENAGRSASNDLAYSYGRARIQKGNVVNNYNYVRIWEIDASHKWNILLEVFSTVDN